MRRTMKKLNHYLPALVLVLCALLWFTPSAHAAEGSCGADLTWELSAGTLTITGSGDMADFTDDNPAPWYELREQISRISLPDGLTSVGQRAFHGCENLTTVTLPDTVTRMGDYAFMDCTGLKMLRLGSGVKTIGEAAFSDCYSLANLSLPSSLTSIGRKAFYRCESITTVTIPAGVKTLGSSAFAYCKNLVKATIKASVALPEWLFYRCDKLSSVDLSGSVPKVGEDTFRDCTALSTVSYSGSGGMTTEQLSAAVNSASTGVEEPVKVTSSGGASKETITGSTLEQVDSNSLRQESTTVVTGENAIVSTMTTTTYDAATQTVSMPNAQVGVLVEGSEGWEEAAALTKSALESLAEAVVEVQLYLNETDGVGQSFLDAMAGQNVKTTVLAEDGSTWKLDFSTMETAGGNASDLRYSVADGSPELNEELETERSFLLSFVSAAEINAEILIHLGKELAWQNATLFQRVNGELSRVQSVVIDTEGYAHFYLASVSDQTEYYIAMNLKDAAAILPDELLAMQNGIRFEPIQYEITGRTSSWNMNIWQVTGIMVAVMVVCIAGVGITMYVVNRRKLRMGYVPPEDE